MLQDFFATKLGMTQAWTKTGKRVAITRCKAADLGVVNVQKTVDANSILEVGIGTKKLKNMPKPLREKVSKSGFSVGYRTLKGVRPVDAQADIQPGAVITVDSVLAVGDVVKVQGITKGRGFAGAMKRHGFHGGPKTHGQSDRARAVGSIGNRTTPGRVWKGKRMPGHYGTETQTVAGLVVVHLDPTTKEVWLSGPIPGSITSQVKIQKTGETKRLELDLAASGIKAPVAAEPVAQEQTEETQA